MREHNPNNWHWVSKNCQNWAKEYFQTELTKYSVEEGSNKVSVKKLSSCDGDVDVSQRKGKIITLFDVKLVLDIEGATKEDENVTGTITIPEVAHDTEEDEYVFDVDIYSETSSKSALRPLIRNKLVPQLRQALSKFSSELIATHGKDVYNPSLNSTPAGSVTATPAVSKPPTPAPVSAPKPKGVHTTSISEDIEFTATAKDLYDVFVQPNKLAAWTKSPPTIEPKVGGKVVLFQGNVRGEFLALNEGKQIEQTWRLPTWPEGMTPFPTLLSVGHYCNLKMVFDQGMETTTLRVAWSGVPLGEEDVTKRNFREYYVNPIKSHLVVPRQRKWSMDKVVVAVAIGTVLIAIVLRLTFGYGHVL